MFAKLSTIRALMLATGLGLMAQACGSDAAGSNAAVDEDLSTLESSEQPMMMREEFTCSPLRCRCSGGEDCNDMFSSGVCSIGPGTGCSGTECWCRRK